MGIGMGVGMVGMSIGIGVRAAGTAHQGGADADSNASGAGPASEAKLFVGQLSVHATREDLLAVFGWFGAVKEIVILTKGSAFVKYQTRAEAEAAVRGVHGRDLNVGAPEGGEAVRRRLVVRFADKPTAAVAAAAAADDWGGQRQAQGHGQEQWRGRASANDARVVAAGAG